ncbi:hypothetical protein [Tessaracoccus palaemonis]|uniref:Ig-like domain-containing protein n=1 Tax=Tessaracoccus palaemonis TaxID=2829499 RepID=A0ABX8SLI8_9ACTN|nr:hypothetical protein [Tessaracoccus palaemonis]QXT63018.1 hypothetical protein KDB89_00570 [Tessaracoccus palaemonis]
MATHARHRHPFLVLLSSAIFAITLVAPAPAHAAAPPKGYPAGTIMQTTHNAKLGIGIPLRRGFFDSDVNKGFGWDKLWSYHNITTLKAVANMSKSTNTTIQGTSVILKTWAGRMECSALSCRVTEQMELRLVAVTSNPGKYTYTAANPKRKVTVSTGATSQSWGVQTAYCVLKSGVRCPDWVTFSLTNPGVPNPKRAAVPATGSTPVSAESAEPQVSPDEQTQAPADEPRADEYTVFSYEPLPVDVDETLVQQARDEGVPLSEID